MDYMKYKLIKESIKFIELCQMRVLKDGMPIELYNMMTNIKINFLKDMMEVEKSTSFLKKRFSSKINSILKINSIIYSRNYSKKANV